ncbi:Gaa1-domain-containing protein [Ramicandelaber brevisporus]|nr:Gaa1-domain-containing protein [Ramicandelaber brevisporus]
MIRRLFLQGGGSTPEEQLTNRAAKVRAIFAHVTRLLSLICIPLLFITPVWLALLPHPKLTVSTRVDENALMPGRTWGSIGDEETRNITQYSHIIRPYVPVALSSSSLNGAGHEEREMIAAQKRAAMLQTEFEKLGLDSEIQPFQFRDPVTGKLHWGANVHAVLRAARGDATEGLLLAAPWLGGVNADEDNSLGVSMVLMMARHHRRFKHLTRDYVFLIADHGRIGANAWLQGYYSTGSSRSTGSSTATTAIRAGPVTLHGGALQAGFAIEMPLSGDTDYRSVEIHYEGRNGQIPNQDIVSIYRHIASEEHMDLKFCANDPDDESEKKSWLEWIEQNLFIWSQNDAREHFSQLKGFVSKVGSQAFGRFTGIHGMFHQYRIDAITLRAVPNKSLVQEQTDSEERDRLPEHGPNDVIEGHKRMAKIVESGLRCVNNLHEHLHHSVSLYVMVSPLKHLPISLLAPPVVVSAVGLCFAALSEWWKIQSDVIEPKSANSKVEIDRIAKQTLLMEHLLYNALGSSLTVWIRNVAFGAGLLTVGSILATLVQHVTRLSLLPPSMAALPLQPLLWYSLSISMCISWLFSTRSAKSSAGQQLNASNWRELRSLTLLLASTMILISTFINIGLAVYLAVTIAIPYGVAGRPSSNIGTRVIRVLVLILSSPYAALFIASWYDASGSSGLIQLLEFIVRDYWLCDSWLLYIVHLIWIPLQLNMLSIALL